MTGSCRAHCHTIVPSRIVIYSIVLLPSSSALAARQGTIIPSQLRKHGSGSYPLDISSGSVPASQVLPTELALSGRCLVVYCWYCGVVEQQVKTRKRKSSGVTHRRRCHSTSRNKRMYSWTYDQSLWIQQNLQRQKK